MRTPPPPPPRNEVWEETLRSLRQDGYLEDRANTRARDCACRIFQRRSTVWTRQTECAAWYGGHFLLAVFNNGGCNGLWPTDEHKAANGVFFLALQNLFYSRTQLLRQVV